MAEVDWADPPCSNTGRGAYGKWVPILAPLMEEPGRWARVATAASITTATSTASNLRRGIVKIPDGAWEFRSSVYDIYARYIGPDAVA